MLHFISPRWAAFLFALVLVAVYCIWPLVIHLNFHSDPYFISLALIAGVASCCVVVGAMLPILDHQFTPDAFRVAIPAWAFHGVLWTVFFSFFIATVATADSIPLLSALTGANEETLSKQRGEFLIARHGWQASLVYVSTVLTSALLPYSLARLILKRTKWSIPAGLSLIAFMELSLVKSMYLQMAIPIAYLSATKKKWVAFVLLVVGSIGLILLNTYLQKAEIDVRKLFWKADESTIASATLVAASPPAAPLSLTVVADTPQPSPASAPAIELKPDDAQRVDSSVMPVARHPYFTSRYAPTSASDHILWRMIAIPTITAADALRVFDEHFHHKHLMGATSTALAALFRLERINYDALVFAYQWNKSEFGRSNSMYLTEAHVNFGWAGVILFSLFVGQSLRWFYLSKDEAFKSLWLVYVYFLAQGSLFGTLFSNAFLALFAIGLFLRIGPPPEPQPIGQMKGPDR